jgi:hypothetical protein
MPAAQNTGPGPEVASPAAAEDESSCTFKGKTSPKNSNHRKKLKISVITIPRQALRGLCDGGAGAGKARAAVPVRDGVGSEVEIDISHKRANPLAKQNSQAQMRERHTEDREVD